MGNVIVIIVFYLDMESVPHVQNIQLIFCIYGINLYGRGNKYLMLNV